jgi:hypothetical protein
MAKVAGDAIRKFNSAIKCALSVALSHSVLTPLTLRADHRVDVAVLPVRDGVSVITRKSP